MASLVFFLSRINFREWVNISNLKECLGNCPILQIKSLSNFWQFSFYRYYSFRVHFRGERDRKLTWLKVLEKKKIFMKKNFLDRNWVSPRELTFASANKSFISRFKTFGNLPKNREITKLCFAKVSYFKVMRFWGFTIEI